MPDDKPIVLDGADNDVLYVNLPGHPGNEGVGIVTSSLRLREVLLNAGLEEFLERLGDTDIILDCDKSGKVIGVEITT